ncbi:hypothetical protein SBOR_6421 [Sclerotinia borealis F-4128]|uniref:Uncharacterized protein n=1 Tax=Sclerotinia borealis (strain F-4128) TaxID=1432307 RepID=W9CEG7_SCLBF|nr:hypothetical protein SBOR_6421 [Sclerotinia borealis F-4128]
MPSNKDRLYIALYARGGKAIMPGKEDTYHWALLVEPKVEVKDGTGMRFHAKEFMTVSGSTWKFEGICIEIDSLRLRNIPIKQGVPYWNCVAWVKGALELLQDDGKSLGTAVTDWTKVRDAAMSYYQSKKDEHGFDGEAD